MFDFSWSQIMLIGVVALVLIGPKDLPIALRAISNMVKKARAMAAEFHTHVDDLMKDADLKGVRDQFKDIRNFDIRSEIEKAVDPDRSIRDTFASNPLDPTTDTYSGADTTLEAAQTALSTAPVVPPPDPTRAYAPAFIPPSLVEPRADLAALAEPPAFVPPGSIRPPPMPPAAAEPEVLSPASLDAASLDAASVDATAVGSGSVEAASVPREPVPASLVPAGLVPAGLVPAGSVDAGQVDAGPVNAERVDSGPVGVASDKAASGEPAPAGASSGVLRQSGSARPADHPT